MRMLGFLSQQSPPFLWAIFLIENVLVTVIALLSGWLVLKINRRPIKPASKNEILICILTNCINTAITYAGFFLWKHAYIAFSYEVNWHILSDFLILFMIMDFTMYVFHYLIHHSTVYKAIHRFHHHYSDPIPIDLFVLHPLETISFGCLWIAVIVFISFNFYAVSIYLIVNVIFGIAGHLGVEPLPARIRNMIPFKFLGTPSFHHRHHLDINHNYGFYTNLWDKLFKTYHR
jgi:lathosterol oxidase